MSAQAQSPTSLPARKSFAQVAAAAAKPEIPRVMASKPTDSSNETAQQCQKDPGPERDVPAASPSPNGAGLLKPQDPSHDDTAHLNVLLKAATLDDPSTSNGLDNFGRKANSDTKSVASRTTFTLDEKESLRPDDSASMQAAGDDDSPTESVIAGAKMASNSDARAFRDQLYEIDRTETSRMLAQRQVGGGGILPQRNGGMMYMSSNGAPQPPVDAIPQPSSSGPPPGLVIPPDEKLQEALASPKDRLFVLKVEQDLIDFVKDSKEHELQLPQTNAFYRMLCHKLAEYYFLGHIVDDSMSAVRIYRLPHSRLPPPLIDSETKPEGSTPPPTSSARKIMRRGVGDPTLMSRDSDGDHTSGRPDTSNGSGSDEDNHGGSKPRDKSALTREEREKQYAEVRARIFEDFSENKNEGDATTGQDSRGLSRASSASGNRKKNKRRPKDDSFEARSAYSQFNGQSYVNQGYLQAQNSASYYSVYGGYPGYQTTPAQSQQGQQAYGMGNGPGPQQDYPSQGQGSWSAQQYGAPYEMNQGMGNMQYGPSHYDPSSGGFQPYPGAAGMHSQSTPKPQQPNLAGYYPEYQQSPNGMPWMQQGYHQHSSGSASPNVYPGAEGGQYMMPYPPQPGFPQNDMAQYPVYPGQPFNPYNLQFNPQSNNFVPRSHSGQWSHMAPGMQQPQHPNSAFTSPRYSNPTPNMSSASRNPSQSHNSRKSSQTSGNMDSITKWATPASLPAKPPPQSSSLAFQIPKYTDGSSTQPLPSHPFAGNNKS